MTLTPEQIALDMERYGKVAGWRDDFCRISVADVETLESLSDAAIRAGHTQTATEGYALALRLRVELGILENGWLTKAIERGVA